LAILKKVVAARYAQLCLPALAEIVKTLNNAMPFKALQWALKKSY